MVVSYQFQIGAADEPITRGDLLDIQKAPGIIAKEEPMTFFNESAQL